MCNIKETDVDGEDAGVGAGVRVVSCISGSLLFLRLKMDLDGSLAVCITFGSMNMDRSDEALIRSLNTDCIMEEFMM